MFAQSSQKNIWTFPNEKHLQEKRVKNNLNFIEKHGSEITNDEESAAYFLTPGEEQLLIKHYEILLNEFCRRFDPIMPRCVVGTSFHYFKRFYLNNSPMDYHPKEMLATCVYLACKVEEFNVSIGQFVNNLKGDRNKAMDIILSNEFVLMQHLNYQLTIHNPYRPIEGFLIDIKARKIMKNAERLRPHIEVFVEHMFFTDASLLHAPSQIALAAVLHAAGMEKENLDSYVTDHILKDQQNMLPDLIGSIRKIRRMVKQFDAHTKDVTKLKMIEKKLEKCRNQENNPDSEIYKERIRKLYLDDDIDFVIEEHSNGENEIVDIATDCAIISD